MTQLKSYFSLCSIIGGGPVGIEPDSGDSPTAILTLSRNVIMRYRLSDQKQIGGWTSKEFITAPVIYDADEKSYVGVFSENKIKVWMESEKNLEKVKKIKFNHPILKLLTGKDGKTTLLFKDGNCSSLNYSMYARKNLEHVKVLKDGDVVVDAAIFTKEDDNYICLIVEKDKKSYSVITCLLNVDINTIDVEKLNRIDVERSEFPTGRVIGITISSKADVPQVFILWSDGRLFSMKLPNDEFTLIGQVSWLNYDLSINMVWIGENHLALYGADTAQEGAALVVFNVSFGVASCRYPLKLFCLGARIWCLKDNLLIEANKQLAVVPFSLFSQRDALSLIGSNKSNSDPSVLNSTDWGNGSVKLDFGDSWTDEAERGIAERDMSSNVLLTLINDGKTKEILTAINRFTDISERLIVSLLNYTLRKLNDSDGETFNDVLRNNIHLKYLLDRIMDLPYVAESLIPHLKINFSVYNTVVLLKYIDFVLKDSTPFTECSEKHEGNILRWGSLLIDSHFQELLLYNDEGYFDIVRNFKNLLDTLIDDVYIIKDVLTTLNSVIDTIKMRGKPSVDDCLLYYVEEMKLF